MIILVLYHFYNMVLLMSCINAGVREENIVDTDCSDAACDRPNTMELQLNPSYAALRVKHMTDCNIVNAGHDVNASHDNPIAMVANPSYAALAEVHVTDSNVNIIDDRIETAPAYDSPDPIVMEVNPSYAPLPEVHVTNSNIIEDHIEAAPAYDSPDPIVMEVNPSYVALADLEVCDDTNINATDVRLQENPSYIALPTPTSQRQDLQFCSSLPVSRGAAVCTLSHGNTLALPLQGQRPP